MELTVIHKHALPDIVQNDVEFSKLSIKSSEMQ